jgi:hypothetical protein
MYEREMAEGVKKVVWKPNDLLFKVYKIDEFSTDRINEFEARELEQKGADFLPERTTMPTSGDKSTKIEAKDSPYDPVGDFSNLFVPWGPQWYKSFCTVPPQLIAS